MAVSSHQRLIRYRTGWEGSNFHPPLIHYLFSFKMAAKLQPFLQGEIIMFLDFLDLVEPMVDGLVSTLYETITYIMVFLVDWFLSAYESSSTLFLSMVGADSYNASMFDVFIWSGVLVTLALFIFHMFVTLMGPVVDQKNDLVELIIRFFITIGLVTISRQLMTVISDYITNVSFNQTGSQSLAYRLSEAITTTVSVDMSELNSDSFLGKAFDITVDNVRNRSFGLIVIIMCIAVTIGFIKVLLKCVERYVLTQLLIIASPVAFGTWTSRTTSSILTNYIRMFISTLFAVLFGRLFLYMICFMISNGAITHLSQGIVLLAFMKLVENLEFQLRALGLTVAQTGGSLLYSIGSGALALGMMAKRIGGGLGTAFEMVGAKQGNLGLSTIGSTMKSLSAGQIPTKAQTIRTFGERGGFGNAIVGSNPHYANMTKQIADMARSGNFMGLRNVPDYIQTDAVKQLLNEGGFDSFAHATGGISSSSIQDAHFTMDGTLVGTASHNGQEIAFKASSTLDPHAQTHGIMDYFAGGSRYVTTQASAISQGRFECDFASLQDGQQSIASTLTNVPIDNQHYANLGVTEVGVSNGILHGYNSAGDLKIATNMETGRSYEIGSESLPVYNSRDEVFSQGSPYNQIYDSLPQGITPTSGIVPDENNARNLKFDYTSPSGTGRVIISTPTDRDIATGSRERLVNMNAYGTAKVSIIPNRQGSQTTEDYHTRT